MCTVVPVYNKIFDTVTFQSLFKKNSIMLMKPDAQFSTAEKTLF